MRPIACQTCGHVYQGSKGLPCPRCAKIDAVLAPPAPEPAPLVIPGPPSELENTLGMTSAPPADLARFAAPGNRIAEVADRLGARSPAELVESDSVECPRCAETIKAKAKVCRFCGAELEDDEEEERAPGRRRRRGSSTRVEAVHEVHHHHAPSGPSPGVAAVLSFLFIGLGQIYCGRLGKGIALMFSGFVIGMFAVFGGALFGWRATGTVSGVQGGEAVGYLVILGFWIFNIFDAYATASNDNGSAADLDLRSRRRRR